VGVTTLTVGFSAMPSAQRPEAVAAVAAAYDRATHVST
jgi:hypothetical protein